VEHTRWRDLPFFSMATNLHSKIQSAVMRETSPGIYTIVVSDENFPQFSLSVLLPISLRVILLALWARSGNLLF